jgi:hypothetical protein
MCNKARDLRQNYVDHNYRETIGKYRNPSISHGKPALNVLFHGQSMIIEKTMRHSLEMGVCAGLKR